MSVESLISGWAVWAWGVSWQLLLVFGAVTLIGRLLAKVPARIRYAAIALVFLKAVIPPSLTVPWTPPAATGVAPTETLGWWGLFSDPIRGARARIELDESLGIQGNPSFWSALALPETSAAPIVYTLFAAWIIGVIVVAGNAAVSQRGLSQAIRGGRLVGSGPIHEQLRACAAELGITRLPRLVLLADAATPFLCGFRRATIVLPAELPGLVGRDELRAILLHELVHLKRHDLGASWCVMAIQTVLWFHPVIWLAGEMLAEERELCVDEHLVRAGCVEPIAYCRTILAVCELASGGMKGALAFLGRFRSMSEVERRIHNVLDSPRGGPRAMVLGWSFVVLLGCVALPMGTLRDGGDYQPSSTPVIRLS